MEGTLIIALIYIGATWLNNFYHRRSIKRLNKLHLDELKRAYEEVDVIMINALKITIDNCVLREDYKQAQAAKDILTRYENNEWHNKR